MDTEKIKRKLAETYAMIQDLQLQPTKHNVDILSAAMRNLDEAYGELSKPVKPEGEKDA